MSRFHPSLHSLQTCLVKTGDPNINPRSSEKLFSIRDPLHSVLPLLTRALNDPSILKKIRTVGPETQLQKE